MLMTKTEEIYPKAKFKWKGTCDLKLLYSKIKTWIEEEEYAVSEKSYGERVKPNGKQLEIVWEARKEEGSYFQKKIFLEIFGIGISEVEVEREGKRLKLHSGELEISLHAEITLNASDDWHDGFVHTLYQDYIIKEKIDEEKINLYKDVHNFMDEVKAFLSLYSFT